MNSEEQAEIKLQSPPKSKKDNKSKKNKHFLRKQKNSFRLHAIQSIGFQLEPIECMEYNAHLDIMALIRGGSVIELWKAKTWNQLQIIQLGKNIGARKLIWKFSDLQLQQTTFFVGCLNGSLLELGLQQVTPITHLRTESGIWDLSYSIQYEKLIAANDDGGVRIYNVNSSEENMMYNTMAGDVSRIRFENVTRNLASRALAVIWEDGKGGGFFVSYQEGIVRKFDMRLNVILTINVKENMAKNQNFAWTLLHFDKNLVMGCSNGEINFYETVYGTRLKQFNVHGSDVLALSFNKNLQTVYASGANSLIISIQNKQPQSQHNEYQQEDIKWVVTSQERGQSTDIRSLAVLNDGVLCSAGLSTDICLYKLKNGRFFDRNKLKSDGVKSKIKLRHITGLPQLPFCSVSSVQLQAQSNSKLHYLLVRKAFSLEIWSIDVFNQQLLFCIDVQCEDPVLTSDLNNDATIFAYSTQKAIKIFSITHNTAKTDQTSTNISIQELIVLENMYSTAIKFSSTSSDRMYLICYGYKSGGPTANEQWGGNNNISFNNNKNSNNATLISYDISQGMSTQICKNCAVAMQKLKFNKIFDEDYQNLDEPAQQQIVVNYLEISKNERFLVLGSKMSSAIMVFNLDHMARQKWEENDSQEEDHENNGESDKNYWFSIANVMQEDNVGFTALSIDPQSRHLYAVYDNNKLAIFDLECKGNLTKLSSKIMNQFPVQFLKRYNRFIGIEINPLDSNRLILYTNFNYVSIDLKAPKNINKQVKTIPAMSLQAYDRSNFDFLKRKNPILFIKKIMDQEFILIEASWKQLLQNLPKAVIYKKFGL